MNPLTPHVQTYPHIYVFFNFVALLCMDCLSNMVFALKMSLHYEIELRVRWVYYTTFIILIIILDNLISLLDFTFRLEDIYICQICVSRAKMISLNFVLKCVAEFAATRFISAYIRYWQELKSCSARLYAFLNIAFYVKRAI